MEKHSTELVETLNYIALLDARDVLVLTFDEQLGWFIHQYSREASALAQHFKEVR